MIKDQCSNKELVELLLRRQKTARAEIMARKKNT
jgi:hypothetical protein